ncbi:hypothetical protein GJV85_00220 [Sulfurimonas aquatica]|uniref:Uncharacterized protein n=1 Tax=Sulfurimonas aquatica TaxID=2672570 RepID=A0A975AXV8_9BACT|nr:hypothetical protein [Sulfurimonas aquatica]QSZ40606.1 hypothetical protein GJV85_00220 [Sulfurimonas aquatica]
MKIALLLLAASMLIAYVPKNIMLCKTHQKIAENSEVKCRWVCDKKVSKERKIENAILFYKNSKYYKFVKKDY